MQTKTVIVHTVLSKKAFEGDGKTNSFFHIFGVIFLHYTLFSNCLEIIFRLFAVVLVSFLQLLPDV